MKTIKTFLILLFAASLLTSCMTTKTSVGGYQQKAGSEYTYGKGKQVWLFWGIMPMGRTNVSTPPDGSCEVITRFNFGDFLISGLTGGIITTQTIKVKAKK